jgi:hypothetical protein
VIGIEVSVVAVKRIKIYIKKNNIMTTNINIQVVKGNSLAKEIVWDKWLKRGTPDFYDFVAGLYGAFGGVFIWVGMETIVK